MRKFFISYTSKDSQKAQWIGWTLKDLGHDAFVGTSKNDPFGMKLGV